MGRAAGLATEGARDGVHKRTEAAAATRAPAATARAIAIDATIFSSTTFPGAAVAAET